MKIYTKTGDDGSTGLFSGGRVKKNSSAIEAYGTVDELNAWIGSAIVVASARLRSFLLQIQHDLHLLCADLATPLDAKKKIDRMTEVRTKRLEKWIDEVEAELDPLNRFILAGGSEAAVRLHVARTVARRAERRMVSFSEESKMNPEALIYMNRLSDFLFVLARLANKEAGQKDVFWDQSL